jgi:hypothetical protein
MNGFAAVAAGGKAAKQPAGEAKGASRPTPSAQGGGAEVSLAGYQGSGTCALAVQPKLSGSSACGRWCRSFGIS